MAQHPWSRREAWRHTGVFAPRARYLAALPGLGLGVGAFAVYCVVEAIMDKTSEKETKH